MNNVSYIFEVHNKTQCLRPAVSESKGNKWNYVVVCCHPSMNGMYAYPAENTKHYNIWMNGNRPCYVVPLDDCQFLPVEKMLQNDKYTDIINSMKIMQEKWFKGEVKNNPKKYPHGKPDWML